MNLIFHGDRVLVEPNKAEEKTASGLYIPDTAKEKPSKGTVIAVGDGTPENPMKYAVGMEVLYGKKFGIEVPIDDKDYLILKQGEIFCEVAKD